MERLSEVVGYGFVMIDSLGRLLEYDDLQTTLGPIHCLLVQLQSLCKIPTAAVSRWMGPLQQPIAAPARACAACGAGIAFCSSLYLPCKRPAGPALTSRRPGRRSRVRDQTGRAVRHPSARRRAARARSAASDHPRGPCKSLCHVPASSRVSVSMHAALSQRH